MRKLGLLVTAAAMVAFAGGAMAGNTNLPSAKHAVMVGNIHVIRELGPIGPGDEATFDDVQTIMSTSIKTGNQKHILAIVSLECGNLTETHVKSKGGKSDTSTAVASVRVAVLVDGQPALPTGDNSRTFTEIDGTPIGGNDGVVFCRRTQELEAKFQGIIDVPEGGTLEGCLEGLVGGLGRDEFIAAFGDSEGDGTYTDDAAAGLAFDAIQAEFRGENSSATNFATWRAQLDSPDASEAVDQATFDALVASADTGGVISDSCLLDEEVRLLLDSMTATSFVFVAPVTSGVHHVEVKAWVDLGAEAQKGSARAAATIGLGTVVVEEIRLVRGLNIECDNTTYGTPACGDDTDGDGIADFADICPSDAGVMIGSDLDSDSDGIKDSDETTEGNVCDDTNSS